MGIENYLIEMGMAGVMIVVLLHDKYIHQKEMKKIIENNTKAIQSLKELFLTKKNS